MAIRAHAPGRAGPGPLPRARSAGTLQVMTDHLAPRHRRPPGTPRPRQRGGVRERLAETVALLVLLAVLAVWVGLAMWVVPDRWPNVQLAASIPPLLLVPPLIRWPGDPYRRAILARRDHHAGTAS